MYQSYSAYCEKTGEDKKSQQAFGRALSKAGYQRTRKNMGNHTVRIWKGLRALPLEIYRNVSQERDSYLTSYIIAPDVRKDTVTDGDGIYENFPEEDVIF